MSARNPPQGQAAVAETATEGPLCGRAGRDGLALPLREELPSLRAGEDMQEAAGWSGRGGAVGVNCPLRTRGRGRCSRGVAVRGAGALLRLSLLGAAGTSWT